MDERITEISTSTTGSEGTIECNQLCLVGNAAKDAQTLRAAEVFALPVFKSDTGTELVNDITLPTVFILSDFENSVLEDLNKPPHKILGSIALHHLFEKEEKIPNISRPLYNFAMQGAVVCFTGFLQKENLKRLATLVYYMGGSIRKDMTTRVTHLIANRCGGEKYQYAIIFKVPVMHESWILNSWEQRRNLNFYSTEDSFVAQYKLKTFFGARVRFTGFSLEETKHMQEVLEENGGTLTQIDDPDCTHIVVESEEIYNSFSNFCTPSQQRLHPRTSTYKSSSQKYMLMDTPGSKPRPEVLDRIQDSQKRKIASPFPQSEPKRRRTFSFITTPKKQAETSCKLEDKVSSKIFSEITREDSEKAFVVKAEWFWSSVQNAACVDEKDYLYRDCIVSPKIQVPQITKSSITCDSNNQKLLSLSPGSCLDCLISPVKEEETKTTFKISSPRHQVFLELLQTETNYVNILKTLITMFKNYLENMPPSEALLNSTELKIIFGNIPSIFETHNLMLEELRKASEHWTEDTSVGKIILSYSNNFLKAYPPFVNFFEKTKETLIQCDQNKPRFHAFLKVCQSKPECGRQSLQELLIRPVQRLPSISLLLKDILKHTSENNADYEELEKALSAIKEVMTHINEDKRKTESQLAMFEIFSGIENCPPDLISSNRNFVNKYEVIELSDILSGRGDQLVLFLFTDILLVCKKRTKVFTRKSRTSNISFSAGRGSTNAKSYKYICSIGLSSITQVINIRETDDCQRKFALRSRDLEEINENVYSFFLTEDFDKITFLKTLCRHIANLACSTEAEKFLISLESHQLDIVKSDIAGSTLSRAFKFATKTGHKVGRALSFNRNIE